MSQYGLGILWVMLLVRVCRIAADAWMCAPTTDSFSAQPYRETEGRVKALEDQVRQLQKLLQTQSYSSFTTIEGFPRNCEEIYDNGTRTDGIYAISPDGRCPFFVHCDMSSGGWTVIQRHIDGSVNFYRRWEEYVAGFGDVGGSHWLGLEKIHRLTRDGSQIYFNLGNYDDTTSYAHYKVFTVHQAATLYKMNVDAFEYEGTISELLSFHNDRQFSTYDRDNDASGHNCCKDSLDGGGWWYKNCYRLGNLNGVYGKQEMGGIGYWTTKNIPVKNVTIKIKLMNGVC